ncbi:DUF3152 domain-containing protein [Saccharothrix sp. S26]|uniref:DUF3152 domain-containing protein n=1 Tax=Saccharothrix sp. S26 TaxID=2907215 RepID=UPI001F3FF148|nr:DUF3152 domain-containing protein [Saccharothrix sp. S26]MCE7000224.1 DUF3152 domain-containing protein [Saccharothrix sp. S26]
MRTVPLLPYLTGVCLAATAVLVLDVGIQARPATVAWPASGVVPSTPAAVDRVGSAPPVEALRSGADLPPGPPFPEHGSGTWHVVPPPGVGGTSGIAYAVEVEDGVVLPHGDDSFAAVVDHALRHPRGWAARHAFRRVGEGVDPQLRIRLTSQRTARSLCGFELPYDTSCRVGSVVHLSTARWFRGAHTYGGDLRGYRIYAVNHEVGHFLGLGHEVCPADGAPAPVMMQQTLSVDNDGLASITTGSDQGVAVTPDGKACLPNPWP